MGGGCIEANHGFLVHVVDATMTEAYALKTGLQLAEHIGSNSFIVQSDCVQIVDTMKDDGFSATSAATIYDECMAPWIGLGNASIEHCYREANRVAPELARRCFDTKQDYIWVIETPRFSLNSLAFDIMVFAH